MTIESTIDSEIAELVPRCPLPSRVRIKEQVRRNLEALSVYGTTEANVIAKITHSIVENNSEF